MNMQKALQHLYKAVSGQDTSKVNISKLLVDIHQAVTGKESANKNNWSRIIDSMAENWSGGGENPNYVQVITSTAKDVFSPDSLRRLAQAIVSGEASATLEMNMNGEALTRPLIASVSENYYTLQFQQANVSISDVKRVVAILAQWSTRNDSMLVQQYIHYANGQNGEYTVTDYTSYAVGINVTLTIIWHPLPEGD